MTNSTGSNVAISTDTTVRNDNQFSIIGWFKVASFTTRAHFYFDRVANGNQIIIRLDATGSVFRVFYQPNPTNITFNPSSAGYVDGNWHWYHLQRRGSTGLYLYVDGIEVANDTTTSMSTNATASVNIYVGADLNGNESAQGDIARFMAFSGSFLTANEANGVAYGMHPSLQPMIHLELGRGLPEPDYSGNGYNGTVGGTTSIVDHPPISFGYVDVLPRLVTAVATGQPTMRRWGGVPGMTYTGRRSW